MTFDEFNKTLANSIIGNLKLKHGYTSDSPANNYVMISEKEYVNVRIALWYGLVKAEYLLQLYFCKDINSSNYLLKWPFNRYTFENIISNNKVKIAIITTMKTYIVGYCFIKYGFR